MTSGIMREPVPGQPHSALDAFAHQVFQTGREVRRLVATNPPQRPVPIFRLDSMQTVTPAAGTVDLYAMPATQAIMSALLDLIVPAATYATVAMTDDLGALASIDLPAGSYLPLTLTATRPPIGALITITAVVSGGTGSLLIRERAGVG